MRLNIKIWGDSLKEFWSYGDEGGLVTSKFSAPLVAKLQYHKLILSSKKEYYSSLVSSASDNPKRLWQTINKLIHHKSSSPLPTTSPGTSLADSFASFFHRQNIQTPSFSHQQPWYIISALTLSSCYSPDFQVFIPASESEIHKIVTNCRTSNMIHIPSQLGFSKNVHPYLFLQSPVLSTSLSFLASFIPLKESVISPLLKKPILDKQELSQLPTDIEYVYHFKNNRMCRQIQSHGSPHFQQSIQFSSVSLQQTLLNWNSSFVHPQSPCQCNRITESVVFGNYAAVAANMPNREFRAPNVVSEMSKLWF